MIYRKLTELKSHPKNDYYFDDTDEGSFEILKESLKNAREQRLNNEIIITEDDIIICGHQRVRACRDLGWEKVNCKVEKGLTEEEIEIKLIMDNLSQRTAKGLNPLKLGRCIDKLKTSDAKEWFLQMQEGGRKFGQLNSIKGMITPAFQTAVEDDILVKNPFNFSLAKVIKNNTKPREPLSKEQTLSFFEFLRNDSCYSKYYDAVYILFNTGLRISELCGLTMNDVDLDNRILHITHQIHRNPKMQFSIETPKTDAGIRSIPMTDDVYECFIRIITKRKRNPLKNEPVVKDYYGNEYTNFLFITERGTLTTACHWDKRINCMVGKYNRTHKQKIEKLTPHICRHSCASQYVAKGSNIKDLQYILGHSKYEVTANTYVKTNVDNVTKTVKNIKILYE